MGLTPRGSSRPTRRQRTENAYRLVVATGTSAVATVAALVLSILGIVSFGWVVLLIIVTAALGLAFRRSVG